jgi:hypothetical protein
LLLGLAGNQPDRNRRSERQFLGCVQDSFGPLMMAKPSFDSATYPLVAANLRNNLRSDQLVVLLNNVADNASLVATIMAAGTSG